MKKFQKGLAISMALAVLMTSTIVTTVMANDTLVTSLIAKADKGGEKVKGQEKQQIKQALEEEREQIESQKDELEAKKDDLEAQYEAAKESGDLEKAAQLKTEMDKIKAEMDAAKQEMQAKKDEIKAAIKASYTADELQKLTEVGKEITKKNKKLTVLPVESIIVKGVNVKFDTPPVIKDGRTLIPVKALSQAFGADVQWIAAERKVIITKGDKKIVLTLDSNKIYVNGVEQVIDVPAMSINSRTVVPLSFILNQLGLKVNWNPNSRDIEIEDPDDSNPVDNTSGSAIVVTGSAITTN